LQFLCGHVGLLDRVQHLVQFVLQLMYLLVLGLKLSLLRHYQIAQSLHIFL
jgi:hypothetical protein